MVDLEDKTANLSTKKGYVERLKAYTDSLHMCCENEEIKKKYRNKCDRYVEKADSTLADYWQKFVNKGIDQNAELGETNEQLSAETDTTSDFYRHLAQAKEALLDSTLLNLEMAVVVGPDNHEAYVALASMHETLEDYETAREWLFKALDRTEGIDERGQVLQPLAYNHARMDEYCEAAPFLREYVDGLPIDASTPDSLIPGFAQSLFHLTICYNNCTMYDSAASTFQRILEIDPAHVDALRGLGRYHRELATNASDSVTHYNDAEDQATSDVWGGVRDAQFDTAKGYFVQVFDLLPDSSDAAEELGITSYLIQDWETAVMAFKRVTELTPDDADHWTTLGDCYIQLADFEGAIFAYEHVAEIEPGNKDVLENLKNLYHELKMTDKENEVTQKLESL
jgi:tetratricopeptide (TPR) repeat protein